jgi:hypothetical protein
LNDAAFRRAGLGAASKFALPFMREKSTDEHNKVTKKK